MPRGIDGEFSGWFEDCGGQLGLKCHSFGNHLCSSIQKFSCLPIPIFRERGRGGYRSQEFGLVWRERKLGSREGVGWEVGGGRWDAVEVWRWKGGNGVYVPVHRGEV